MVSESVAKEKNIEDHEVGALDFYPLKSENDWMYLMLGCENPKNSYVLHGKIQEDDEGNEGIFCNFDSQVYYRLVHNLFWAHINKDNISSYLRIFGHHQRLEFNDIEEMKSLCVGMNIHYIFQKTAEKAIAYSQVYTENNLEIKVFAKLMICMIIG